MQYQVCWVGGIMQTKYLTQLTWACLDFITIVWGGAEFLLAHFLHNNWTLIAYLQCYGCGRKCVDGIMASSCFQNSKWVIMTHQLFPLRNTSFCIVYTTACFIWPKEYRLVQRIFQQWQHMFIVSQYWMRTQKLMCVWV